MVNNIWWTGVVEDRNDPEKLGRCKVRIFGYHTEDTRDLPTRDLPWALPLQPITSAATSGVGSSPVGIVPGAWVVGFFLDGTNAQQPIIMGTLAGKPKVTTEVEEKIKQVKEEEFFLKDAFGNIVYDSQGQPISKESKIINIRDSFYPLLANRIDLVLQTLSKELSNDDISKVGNNNELGKYQMDVSSLINLGYLRRPEGGIVDYDVVDDDSLWTGKDGASSKDNFLRNGSLQEKVMLDNMKFNFDTMVRLGKIKETTDPTVVGSLLATAHLVGPTNADKLDRKTNDGILLRDYFTLVNSSLGGDELDFALDIEDENTYISNLDNDVSKNLNNEELSKVKGFSDPNKKYPKYEYAGLSDVNKLAIGDMSHLSVTKKTNKRITGIELPFTNQTWDEPDSAYAAVYPYNQVIETEAGHVIELDSTPNAERIHVFHKTGTYIEIDVNGSMVRKTVGDNYEVMDRNNFVFVKGASTLTVEGKTSILVKDNATIEVEGDLNVTGHGDTLVQTAKNAAIVSKTAVISAQDSLDIVSGGALKLQGKSIVMHASGGTVGIKADQDLNLQGGTTTSVKGGIAVNLQAAIIRNQMGGTSIGPIGLATIPPPEERNPNRTQLPVLQRTIARDEFFLYDSEEPDADSYKANLLAEGSISDLIIPASSVSTRSIFGSAQTPVIPMDASEIDKFTTFPRSFRLSKYFTLGDLLVGNRGVALVAQGGLTEKDIVLNLKTLAVNVLDPVKEKYKDMIITSGFRAPFVGSDHDIGAAVDIMFRRTNFRLYKDIATWMSENVPYRQLLLEYRFNSVDKNPQATWIHVSLLQNKGKIIPSSRASTGTFRNHAIYARDKFINLA